MKIYNLTNAAKLTQEAAMFKNEKSIIEWLERDYLQFDVVERYQITYNYIVNAIEFNVRYKYKNSNTENFEVFIAKEFDLI
jgi:hypothetical protein